MKIGRLKLKLVKPAVAALDEQLIEATGCSAAEWRRMLGEPLAAGMVAQALTPFVGEPPAQASLARAIEREGANEVRAKVLALYADTLSEKGKRSDG